jgi:DNA-directed RNA polymerase specialized sigma24 family protein
MNIKQKDYYLRRYERANNKVERLESALINLHSVKYDNIKTTQHKSLEQKIHERDMALAERIDLYLETCELIDTLSFNQHEYTEERIALFYKYLSLIGDKEIAERMHCSVSKVKKLLNNGLDLLEI